MASSYSLEVLLPELTVREQRYDQLCELCRREIDQVTFVE